MFVQANLFNEKTQSKNEFLFENFRLEYPGVKRGFKTEFEYFKKKNKNWTEVLPILQQNLIRQKRERSNLKYKGRFVPEWKHLKTYLGNQSWEETFKDQEEEQARQWNEKNIQTHKPLQPLPVPEEVADKEELQRTLKNLIRKYR